MSPFSGTEKPRQKVCPGAGVRRHTQSLSSCFFAQPIVAVTTAAKYKVAFKKMCFKRQASVLF